MNNNNYYVGNGKEMEQLKQLNKVVFFFFFVRHLV